MTSPGVDLYDRIRGTRLAGPYGSDANKGKSVAIRYRGGVVSVSKRVVVVNGGSEHSVQFFDTLESRATHVARFLAPGFPADEAMIVIAEPAHWEAIAEQLATLGLPVEDAFDSGRLIVKDAVETLALLSPRGRPDAAAFEAHVGGLVRGVGRRGIRAYGEMVDILCGRRDVDDMLLLEAFWNRLAAVVPFRLLCGYASAHFVPGSVPGLLENVCRAHSSAHAHEQDPLGAWLLGELQRPAPAAWRTPL